jgi:hypothetical protein
MGMAVPLERIESYPRFSFIMVKREVYDSFIREPAMIY